MTALVVADLCVSDVERSIHTQLRAHGFVPGTPDYAAAAAVARNVAGIVWIAYETARAEVVKAEGRA